MALSIETASTSGTVRLRSPLPVDVSTAWQAITAPHQVSQWFATQTAPLKEGESSYLDFEDGDFFTLQVLRIAPPRLIQFAWRFLGIGPLEIVTWQLDKGETGSTLQVTDEAPERSPETVAELEEGWLDFLQRLQRYLLTGQKTRYAWRKEFDASIELPLGQEKAWETLFTSRPVTDWLPIDTPTLTSGTTLKLTDGYSSSAFELSEIVWNFPTSVQFKLGHGEWLNPTPCLMQLGSRKKHQTTLSIHHKGWDTISPNQEQQILQRQRFSLFWISTLKQVQVMIQN